MQTTYLVLYMSSVVFLCCPELVPDNAFKTLFLVLTRVATCSQCVLNENKVSIYTPSNFGQRTRRSSESSILIFGWALACAGSGVNKVTDDFGADTNSELTRKNMC